MNSFKELITLRQSCRNYKSIPVETEKLHELIEATKLSPSACNSQPWRFIVVSSNEAQKVRDSVQRDGRNGFTDNCPAFTIVVEEKAKLLPAIAEKMPSQTFAQIDLGIAIAHYCLAATELGLSTCIIGWMDEDKLKEAFNISQDEKVRIVIATGYASDEDKIRDKKRKTTEEISVFID